MGAETSPKKPRLKWWVRCILYLFVAALIPLPLWLLSLVPFFGAPIRAATERYGDLAWLGLCAVAALSLLLLSFWKAETKTKLEIAAILLGFYALGSEIEARQQQRRVELARTLGELATLKGEQGRNASASIRAALELLVKNQINLQGIDLSGLDLTGASLPNARLENANLSSVDLSSVDLSNASLSAANLSNSTFIHTNFSNADLFNADLSDSEFLNVVFSNAHLRVANLSNCFFFVYRLFEYNPCRGQSFWCERHRARLGHGHFS